MKFKDYRCRECGTIEEYMFGDTQEFPRVIPDGCECGGTQDLCVMGGKVHLPASAQAVPRERSLI
jgi:hypothetical protein